jgi:adenylate cyclase class 2
VPIEYEAKFLNIDKEAIRNVLAEAGYICVLPEFLFRRQTFNVPGFDAMKWGRVRWENDKINLSIKHTVDKTRVDGTHEISLDIPLGDDPARQYTDAIAFVTACGLEPGGTQENIREIWVKDTIEICIDSWPGVNPYLEIEAENEEQVRDACAELNLDFSRALFGGITTVYETELGISADQFAKIEAITFDNPPRSGLAA